ncbi:MAG: hypothetical protein M1533_06030 [Candidatus Thermoplasmatota archaeon]|jgi:hypothetical protein|nr:hypothetical protein [Candidatus Thermoplasmatota archaeon]MCL5793404.1 hypothetical protein [Candidatus Thermoplasmatota archaeon]
MAPKVMAVVMVLALIASAGVTIAASNDGGVSGTSVGNFSLNYNSTASTITDLSYKGDNNSVGLASYIKISNSAPELLSMIPAVKMNNGSVLSTSNENAFILASGSLSITNSIKINMTLYNQSSPVYVKLNSSLFFGGMGMSVNTQSMALYEITVNGHPVIIFSNGNGTLSGNGYSLSFSARSMLVVGMMAKMEFEDSIMQKLYSEKAFQYNSSTGQVTGSFLDFNINAKTGVISNFQSNLMNQKVFTSVYAFGNGDLTSSSSAPVIPVSSPVIIGSLFAYLNNTSLMVLRDNPSLVSNFFVSNGTMVFNVGTGITKINEFGANATSDTYTGAEIDDSSGNFFNYSAGMSDQIDAGAHGIYLAGNGFRGFLFVNGGNISVTGSTITVQSNQTARISFVAPPGLQGSSSKAIEDINNAIMHGKIAAQISIDKTSSTPGSLTLSYNNSVSIQLTNASSGSLTFITSSLKHTGTVIAIFISNSVISNNSRLVVKFDNTVATVASENFTINTTSDVNAVYAVFKVSGGVEVLIHIPHFSTHTIQVYTASGTNTTLLSAFTGPIGVGFIIIVLVGIVAAVAMASRRKKAGKN